MSGKKGALRPSKKRAYRTPTLKVHGDLRKLTTAKGGGGGDGGGKPATKASGPSA